MIDIFMSDCACACDGNIGGSAVLSGYLYIVFIISVTENYNLVFTLVMRFHMTRTITLWFAFSGLNSFFLHC